LQFKHQVYQTGKLARERNYKAIYFFLGGGQ